MATITIELNDDTANKLDGIKLDKATQKKIKVYQLNKILAKAEAEVADIKAEIAELEK